MENKVTIKFNEKISFDLSSDNPNIEDMMKTAIDNKDKIDLDKIEILCSIESFDSSGFKEILKKSLENFFEDIKINTTELKNILTKEEK